MDTIRVKNIVNLVPYFNSIIIVENICTRVMM